MTDRPLGTAFVARDTLGGENRGRMAGAVRLNGLQPAETRRDATCRTHYMRLNPISLVARRDTITWRR